MSDEIEMFETFLSVAAHEGVYSSPTRLRRFLNYVFGELSCAGKDVLDIGGGAGLLSAYALLRGARSVTMLEPEAAGSSSDKTVKLRSMQARLPFLGLIDLQPLTIQAFDAGEKLFDLIIAYNSINHLDEKACIQLHKDPYARELYFMLFSKINQLARQGAHIVICDCARRSFYQLVGLRNPFARSTEWQKHQHPKEWIQLLKEAGFENPHLSWTSFNCLGRFGRLFLGNRAAAFFTLNHFRLAAQKM
jgi:2-polyprenyl-3-methyl-5-hydroxy-6-metoxy-1,4-benzoquinol methylase